MNKKTATENRNDFLHEVNTKIADEGRNINFTNKQLDILNLGRDTHLKGNPREEYRQNVMDTNERLKNCGIQFFGGQFYLRKVYQEELNTHLDAAINAYNKLVEKLDKIGTISYKHPKIIGKLARTSLFTKMLSPEINEFNIHTQMIREYRVEDDLVALLYKKYSVIDPTEAVSGSVFFAYALDLNMIEKMGLDEKFEPAKADIAGLVYIKEADILKQKETGEKEKVKTIEKNGK